MTDPAVPPAAPPQRFHALDSLRAFCMLLGIVLHSSISYMEKCPPWWPADPFRFAGFDMAVFVIHAFRMETFFVMSGFLSRMMYERRGPRAFAANRAARVLLPLLVFTGALSPIFIGLNPFGGGAAEVMSVAPWHLWFLYYLVVFYAAVLAADALFGPRLAATRTGALERIFARIVQSPAAPVLLAVPTAAVLMMMDTYITDTPLGPLPKPRLLLHYGLFFGFGWLLYRRGELLQVLARRWWIWLAAALPVLAATASAIGAAVADIPPGELAMVRPGDNPWLVAAARWSLALLIWLLVLGVTGAFLALMNRDRPTIRWLAGSAYWLYIAHLPVVVWLQLLLRDSPVPGPLRFPAVVGVSLLLLCASYQWLVRSTPIGVMLNGRRNVDEDRPQAPTGPPHQ